MKRPIGVFDSGVGGLTVVKELMRLLPNENIIYFGDTARVPYGIKSKETIVKFSLENILFLLKQEVKTIVIACNTSSSTALPLLKRHFKIPIIGVIGPGVKEAIYATRNKRIGVIATKATINSHAYERQIKRLNPKIKVFNQACPLLVPLAEEGWARRKETRDIANFYLKPMKKSGIDTLILGCTHYPLLKEVLRRVLGNSVRLIDSARQVAYETKEILASEGLLNNKKKQGKYIFYVSDELQQFKKLAKNFLGKDIENLKKVNNV
ncbi:MAG: glutamate racemase [Candidatus Omnitrophica bacterium]|nr:glutamate racemase [Candidatus Omnitrophota bacterium]MDD5352010.1 glutamate racemase [Candidatus Omnitrophota bacterium]MDD5551064.1 glutamate racemase [Candidatus Omnitrophota bacterium]